MWKWSHVTAMRKLFQLFRVWFLFQLQKLRWPKWEQGLWLWYMLTVCGGRQFGSTKNNHMGQGIVSLHWEQKGNLIYEERHLLVSSFLLARTRSVISPTDFSWQTKHSTVFNVIHFCWAFGTIPCQMLSHLNMLVLLSWQKDLWEFDACMRSVISKKHNVLSCCMSFMMLWWAGSTLNFWNRAILLQFKF